MHLFFEAAIVFSSLFSKEIAVRAVIIIHPEWCLVPAKGAVFYTSSAKNWLI
jgi:hypothetical protein